MDIKIILIIYLLIIMIHYKFIKYIFKSEYIFFNKGYFYIKKSDGVYKMEKFEFGFYRALFFPITWIRIILR